MAQIYGQIESLKTLKSELKSQGINRFNSVRDIYAFARNFQTEKENIVANQRNLLKSEVEKLKLQIRENTERIPTIRSRTITEIDVRKDTIKYRIEYLTERISRSFFHRVLYTFSLNRQKRLLEHYSTNAPAIIQDATRKTEKIIINDEDRLKYCLENYEQIISDRSNPEIKELDRIRSVIKSKNSLIAGAVGENLVVKEIENLSDDFILLNDYNLKFNPPLYNKSNGDKIFSIQIDHLLISKSGIYILETKNWSKKSIESLDLRSPVEQITRTSYALFILVNHDTIRLANHHWGTKKIPIRNIIVMINEKPEVEFQYVKVKSVYELNSYISFFAPVLSEKEVKRIARYLMKLGNY